MTFILRCRSSPFLLQVGPRQPNCTLHVRCCLVVDDRYYSKYWHLIDRLVQQVVLQQRDGTDPDVAPTKLDVDGLVQQ